MKMRMIALLGCLIILALAVNGSASGNPAETTTLSTEERGLGAEHQVSAPANPEMNRNLPAEAYDSADQSTLVVWARHDSSTYYIEGRLVDYLGRPIGSAPVTIASGATPLYQPAVAYNPHDYQYLVTWMRNTSLDGKTYEIWGEILSVALTVDKPEFVIAAPASGYSFWSPREAWNHLTYEYMTVFSEFDTSTNTPVRINEDTVSASGHNFGTTQLIGDNDSYHPGMVISPYQADVVYANDGGVMGNYMAVWSQVKPGTTDHDIHAELVDAKSGHSAGDFVVNASDNDQENPRIATNGANDYMVVWQERSPRSPYDWDVHAQEINQVGAWLGDVVIVAGEGSTDETNPFVAAWPGSTPHYVVGYERQSDTGQDIYLAHYNNGADTLSILGDTFWEDFFPAAAYSFNTNASPVGVIAGLKLQLAYTGVSNIPGDHTQVYTRTWMPFTAYVPYTKK